MFILTLKDREEEGAYSVLNPEGEHIVYLFQEEDDAVRYAMMLEEDDYPEMHILEVEDDLIIEACEKKNYNYTVITPDDIVVPPNSSYYDTV